MRPPCRPTKKTRPTLNPTERAVQKFPYLPYLSRKSGSIQTLCRICAEKQNYRRCRHREGRSWIACYVVPDLLTAIGCGYVVEQTYEMWVYWDSGPILRPFYQAVFAFKLRATDFELADGETYDDLNRRMGLGRQLAINSANHRPCPVRRQIYKGILNQSLGRLAPNGNKIQKQSVSSPLQLASLLDRTDIDINRINIVTDSRAEVTFRAKYPAKQPERAGCRQVINMHMRHSQVICSMP